MTRWQSWLGYVTIAVAATVALSACSSTNFGGLSAYGSNKLEVAELANIGSYDAEHALAEARAHFRNRDYGHSAAFYKRVVELRPKDPEGYIGLGASYDRLRRFDLSDRVYASLHDLSGGTVQYYNNVGYSFLLRGNLRQALQSLQKAHSLDPDNIVVANNLQILADAAAKARA